VEVSDSNPLPVEDSVCTRIIALEVLEHVDDPHQFMRELVRVAKPGALFLLAVPDYRSEAVQQGIAPDSYWEKPNHIRVFGRDELAGLARESGLSVTHSECKSFFWAMWWTLFWARDQQFGAPENPVLFHWTQTWNELLNSRGGERIARKLDETMPKSQVVVARKAA
jgi:SAM-dependent methyltransferase